MTSFSHTLKVTLPVLVWSFVAFGVITVAYSVLGFLVSKDDDLLQTVTFRRSCDKIVTFRHYFDFNLLRRKSEIV